MKRTLATLYAILALVFFTPLHAQAADCWVVSGAGTGSVNGTYLFLNASSFALSAGGTTGMAGQAAYSKDGATTNAPVLAVTSGDGGGVSYNATEMRAIDGSGTFSAGVGYYYSVAGSGDPDDYSVLDTVNVSGTAPVPTVTLSSCGGASFDFGFWFTF